MRNKSFLNLAILCVFMLLSSLLLSACEKGNNNETGDVEDEFQNVLEIEEIKKQEKFCAFFEERNLSIESMEIVKRQINEENKEDILYVDIVAKNSMAKTEAEFRIYSIFYDEGGWITEDVKPQEVLEYEPIGYPQIDIYTEDCEINILPPTINGNNSYIFNYERIIEGEFAKIVVPSEIICNFSVQGGRWDHREYESDVQYTIKDINGTYSDGEKNFLSLRTDNNKLYLYALSNDSTYDGEEFVWTVYNKEEKKTSSDRIRKVDVKLKINGEEFHSQFAHIEIPQVRFEVHAMGRFISWTVNLYISGDKLYTHDHDGNYVYLTKEGIREKGTKVYFTKPDEWEETVYAFIYDETSLEYILENEVWPGAMMQKESDRIYSYTFDQDWNDPMIIFSDGFNQSNIPGQPGFIVIDEKMYKVDE